MSKEGIMYVAPKANALTQDDAPVHDVVVENDTESHAIPKIHAALADNIQHIAHHDIPQPQSSGFPRMRLPEFFRSGWDLKFAMLCLLLLFGINLVFYGMTRMYSHDGAEISFSSNAIAAQPLPDNLLSVYPRTEEVPDMQPMDFDNQRVIFFDDKNRSQLLRYLKRPPTGQADSIETYVKPQ